MTTQPNQITDEQMQALAAAQGTSIPEQELPYLTRAFGAVMLSINQLSTEELCAIQPPLFYRVPCSSTPDVP